MPRRVRDYAAEYRARKASNQVKYGMTERQRAYRRDKQVIEAARESPQFRALPRAVQRRPSIARNYLRAVVPPSRGTGVPMRPDRSDSAEVSELMTRIARFMRANDASPEEWRSFRENYGQLAAA